MALIIYPNGNSYVFRERATHTLDCRHAINSRVGWDYKMDCIILKEMPNDRLKILVFGNRYWAGNQNKKRVRYVDKHRVNIRGD